MRRLELHDRPGRTRGPGAVPVLVLLSLAGILAGCSTTGPTGDGRVELGAREFSARDGKALPYTRWEPSGTPRAVVVAVHGLSGAASDFVLLGERLPAAGIAVYAPELRGQGNDPDEPSRGDIASARLWSSDLRDFTALVAARHPGAPVVWYGESLGALVVLDTVARSTGDGADRPWPAGIVLAAPVAGFRDGWPKGKVALARAAALVAPEKRLSVDDLAGETEVRVTSDTTHRGQMAVTPHAVESFTLRTLSGVWGLVDTSGPAAASLPRDLPVLVLYTPNDPLSSREQVERFFGNINTRDKTRRFFPNSYHLILHDVERDVAVATVQGWLEARF